MIERVARIRVLQIAFLGAYWFRKKLLRLVSFLKFKVMIKNQGDNCMCHYSTEIKFGQNIKIGSSTRFGQNCVLGGLGGISIGSNVVVSKNVVIESAGLKFKDKNPPYKHQGAPIFIGDGVWIGVNSIILGGVTIGENTIIGAGSVVSNSLPANSIVVGSKNQKTFPR